METLVMAFGVILIIEGALNLLSALYTMLAVRRVGKLHPEAQSVLEAVTGKDLNGDGVIAPDVARADAEIKDLRADLSGPDKWTMTGQAMANVSMKGFTYKEEQKEYKVDGQGTYRRVTDVDVDGAGLGGFGMAIDFGATF